MAFFDKLSKKIINVGQDVSQSTKNLADIVKLNNHITDYEKQIADLYTTIGKVYYENHKNDLEAEELQHIQAINALHTQINDLQEKVKGLKGVVKCPQCGFDVKREAQFCSNCGYRLVVATTEIHCANCGSVVSEDSVFCSNCGTRVERETTSAVVEVDNVVPQRSCPSCNNIVAADDMFCPECGTKIDA